VLSQKKCDDIVDIFEINDKQYVRQTINEEYVVCKQIKYKNTNSYPDSIINNVTAFINNILDKYLERIVKHTENKYIYSDELSITFEKYDAMQGFRLNCVETNSNNNVKFILFLNNTNSNNRGQIVFNDEIFVQPKAGTLVLFPNIWCINYKQHLPIYHDVMLLTGIINIV